jgi:hypothetical protein
VARGVRSKLFHHPGFGDGGAIGGCYDLEPAGRIAVGVGKPAVIGELSGSGTRRSAPNSFTIQGQGLATAVQAVAVTISTGRARRNRCRQTCSDRGETDSEDTRKVASSRPGRVGKLWPSFFRKLRGDIPLRTRAAWVMRCNGCDGDAAPPANLRRVANFYG